MKLPTSYDKRLRPLIRLTLRPYRRSDGTYLSRVRMLPFWLTISRLGIAPLALPLGLAVHYHWLAAFIVLATAIALLFITDAFDGAVAREIGCVSDTGALLDPLVDKVATAAVIIAWLANAGTWLVWLLPVVFVRVALDIGLAAVAQMERTRQLHPRAEQWGKRKFHTDLAALFTGVIGAYAGAGSVAGLPLEVGAVALVVAAIALGVLSLRGHWRNLQRA